MNHTYFRNQAPILLSSTNLTRLYSEIAKQTEAGKACDAERWRLEKLRRADILDQTVTHYLEPTKVAVLGVTEPKVRANAITGVDPNEEARRLDDIARIARGEPIAERPNIDSQIENLHRTRAAIEVNLERIEREISEERRKLGAEYLLKIKKDTDALALRFSKAVIDLHGAYHDVKNLHQAHQDSGIGFPANTPSPDFLRSADSFFNAAALAGFINDKR